MALGEFPRHGLLGHRLNKESVIENTGSWESSGGLVVRILGSHCCGSIPGPGTEMLQASGCGQKKKKNYWFWSQTTWVRIPGLVLSSCAGYLISLCLGFLVNKMGILKKKKWGYY